MCDPNPITLFRISFLNPVTVLIATTITANPSEIPKIAIPVMLPEKRFRLSLSLLMRLAINSSVFKFG
jgi:hypothetical protein